MKARFLRSGLPEEIGEYFEEQSPDSYYRLDLPPGAVSPGVAYMDGQYLPIGEAKISVLDNGFLHSDATYDVVHVWKGAFFRLDDHLNRFFGGMEKLNMSIPQDRAQIVERGQCINDYR